MGPGGTPKGAGDKWCARCKGSAKCPHCLHFYQGDDSGPLLVNGVLALCPRCVGNAGVCPYCKGETANSPVRATQTQPGTDQGKLRVRARGSVHGDLKRTDANPDKRSAANSSHPSPEGRKQARISAKLEVEVRFDSWQVYKLMYSRNISKGGVMLQLPHEAPIGGSIELKVHMPDGEVLSLPSVVRHCHRDAAETLGSEQAMRAGEAAPAAQEYQVGVKFAAMDAASKKRLFRNLVRLEHEFNGHTDAQGK